MLCGKRSTGHRLQWHRKAIMATDVSRPAPHPPVAFYLVLIRYAFLHLIGAKSKTKENLKEMHDVQSGMASAIIQLYLKQVGAALITSS